MLPAIAAVYCSIFAVLSPAQQRVVDNILTHALAEGLLTDDAATVIERLVDHPPKRRLAKRQRKARS